MTSKTVKGKEARAEKKGKAVRAALEPKDKAPPKKAPGVPRELRDVPPVDDETPSFSRDAARAESRDGGEDDTVVEIQVGNGKPVRLGNMKEAIQKLKDAPKALKQVGLDGKPVRADLVTCEVDRRVTFKLESPHFRANIRLDQRILLKGKDAAGRLALIDSCMRPKKEIRHVTQDQAQEEASAMLVKLMAETTHLPTEAASL